MALLIKDLSSMKRLCTVDQETKLLSLDIRDPKVRRFLGMDVIYPNTISFGLNDSSPFKDLW